MQYLIRKIKKINPYSEKIGKYYYDDPKKHTNDEFDVATYDSNGYVFISKVCFLLKEEIM